MSSANALEVAPGSDCLSIRRSGSTAMMKSVPEAGQP